MLHMAVRSAAPHFGRLAFLRRLQKNPPRARFQLGLVPQKYFPSPLGDPKVRESAIGGGVRAASPRRAPGGVGRKLQAHSLPDAIDLRAFETTN